MARFLPALPLIGGGRTLFQPVFVSDAAAAIVTALDDPKLVADTPDEAYTAAGKPKRTSAASDTESAEPRHALVHAGGDAVPRRNN